MHTRAKRGYLMPKQHLNLSLSTDISPIPSSYRTALKDTRWHDAMRDEFDALIRNDTWSLVPCPAGVNVVTGKWIFRHKLNPDGSLSLGIKLAGSFEDLLNKRVLTMGKPSVLS
jgi:histone deacetylase 1/2